MIFYNKIFTNADLEEAKKWRDDSGYAEEYPRSNDPCPEKNFWYRPDTICKWTSILRMFELIEKDNMKIIDLGVGESPVPHIICKRGHKVEGCDIRSVGLPYQSLVSIVLKDAFDYLKEYQENSVDVILDGCAVTHFGNGDTTDEFIHCGWGSVLKSASKILRSGGVFIGSSDTMIDKRFKEFLLPEQIVEIANSYGLQLYGTDEFDYGRENAMIRDQPRIGTLGVSNFIFIKND